MGQTHPGKKDTPLRAGETGRIEKSGGRVGLGGNCPHASLDLSFLLNPEPHAGTIGHPPIRGFFGLLTERVILNLVHLRLFSVLPFLQSREFLFADLNKEGFAGNVALAVTPPVSAIPIHYHYYQRKRNAVAETVCSAIPRQSKYQPCQILPVVL